MRLRCLVWLVLLCGLPPLGRASQLLVDVERAELANRVSVIAAAQAGQIDTPALIAFLQRVRTHPPEARALLLQSLGATVPDATGKFVAPPRGTNTDKLDWLVALTTSAEPSAGEMLADVIALRLLSEVQGYDAADAIFEVAFAPATMMYRDECGRLLRSMNPRSLPALIRRSKSSADIARYANYQLERLDRQDPHKALGAGTHNASLQLAILAAFRDVKHREAVAAVWSLTNDDVRVVRDAARATWNAYVTGPPPKSAPRRRLQLTGGRVAKKSTPLYLTYRELAEEILRKELEREFGEELDPVDAGPDGNTPARTGPSAKPDLPLDPVAATNRLFARFDSARDALAQAALTQALATAASDAPAAARVFDELRADGALTTNQAVADVYVGIAAKAAHDGQYAAAIAAWAKAEAAGHRLSSSQAAQRLEALAQLADGPTRAALLTQAGGLDPAMHTQAHPAGRKAPRWPLPAAGGFGALAIGLGAWAWRKRR